MGGTWGDLIKNRISLGRKKKKLQQFLLSSQVPQYWAPLLMHSSSPSVCFNYLNHKLLAAGFLFPAKCLHRTQGLRSCLDPPSSQIDKPEALCISSELCILHSCFAPFPHGQKPPRRPLLPRFLSSSASTCWETHQATGRSFKYLQRQIPQPLPCAGVAALEPPLLHWY